VQSRGTKAYRNYHAQNQRERNKKREEKKAEMGQRWTNEGKKNSVIKPRRAVDFDQEGKG